MSIGTDQDNCNGGVGDELITNLLSDPCGLDAAVVYISVSDRFIDDIPRHHMDEPVFVTLVFVIVADEHSMSWELGHDYPLAPCLKPVEVWMVKIADTLRSSQLANSIPAPNSSRVKWSCVDMGGYTVHQQTRGLAGVRLSFVTWVLVTGFGGQPGRRLAGVEFCR